LRLLVFSLFFWGFWGLWGVVEMLVFFFFGTFSLFFFFLFGFGLFFFLFALHLGPLLFGGWLGLFFGICVFFLVWGLGCDGGEGGFFFFWWIFFFFFFFFEEGPTPPFTSVPGVIPSFCPRLQRPLTEIPVPAPMGVLRASFPIEEKVIIFHFFYPPLCQISAAVGDLKGQGYLSPATSPETKSF